MLTTGDDLQGSSEQAWRLQIEETIKSHFARQRELNDEAAVAAVTGLYETGLAALAEKLDQ